MIADYDPSSEVHEHNLQVFYEKVFKKKPNLDVKNDQGHTMVCEDWKDIGFQGKNPRTDFRGGGHLSLLCLLYMIDNYPNEFDELAKCTKDQEDLMWLTAISSINITHGLLIYFHLNTGNVAPSQAKIVSGREQFKKFCKLNCMSKRTFFELNCFGLRYVYKEWINMVNKTGKDKIPMLMGQFSNCMEKTKLAIH